MEESSQVACGVLPAAAGRARRAYCVFCDGGGAGGPKRELRVLVTDFKGNVWRAHVELRAIRNALVRSCCDNSFELLMKLVTLNKCNNLLCIF